MLNKIHVPIVIVILTIPILQGCATMFNSTESITISSSPTGADVTVDGIPQGKTPVTVDISSKGEKSQVVISKNGFNSAQTVLKASSKNYWWLLADIGGFGLSAIVYNLISPISGTESYTYPGYTIGNVSNPSTTFTHTTTNGTSELIVYGLCGAGVVSAIVDLSTGNIRSFDKKEITFELLENKENTNKQEEYSQYTIDQLEEMQKNAVKNEQYDKAELIQKEIDVRTKMQGDQKLETLSVQELEDLKKNAIQKEEYSKADMIQKIINNKKQPKNK